MDAGTISSAIANFSTKFVNELEKDKSSVSSPLSAEFVLALLTLGSSEPAHDELLTALGIPDDEAIRSSFSILTSKIKSLEGVTLNVANKVYIMEGDYDLNTELKNDAHNVFDADFEKVDFGDPSASTEKINQWVESQTNDKIKDLLSSDSVDQNTRLVLINALYFKGTWEKKFNKINTIDQPFHLTLEDTVQVPMMYKESDYKYGESDVLNAQLLEMPYVGGEASMLIVLPREVEGLTAMLDQMASGFDLIEEVSKMNSTKVQVSVPRFKIETEIDLLEVLPKLGIKAIFDRDNSGLTGVLDSPEPLFVSKAVQKAFIEVNEEGAEAAAATAMGIAFCSAMVDFNPVQRFVADRPFLAAILVAGVPHFVATYYAN